jgi:hypothetical protein
MKNKPDPADSSLKETMAARIEIKELGDLVCQKEITDAVEALGGVIETKIEKGALHVSYDPLATTEKKIAGYPLHWDHDQSCGHRHGRRASRPADIKTRRLLLEGNVRRSRAATGLGCRAGR